jgi:probable rRNA maturation factor
MPVPLRRTTRLRVVVLAPDGARRPAGLGSWLAGVAPRAARGEVAVALVSDRRMRTLNRSFRGVDAVTDVLSFPAFAGTSPDSHSAPASARRSAPPALDTRSQTASAKRSAPTSPLAAGFLGDVVIASGVATRQAAAAGHAVGTELRVLALHGLLHLLGYDHETDDGAMARTERRLRRRGQLREGLIERQGPVAPRARR